MSELQPEEQRMVDLIVLQHPWALSGRDALLDMARRYLAGTIDDQQMSDEMDAILETARAKWS